MQLGKYAASISLLGSVSAGIARAAALPPPPVITNSFTGLGTTLWCPIISSMFWVLIIISIIMVLWAAYLYVTAGDDTEQVHKATKTITYAAVAIVVAFLAVGFPYVVASIFPSADISAMSSCA